MDDDPDINVPLSVFMLGSDPDPHYNDGNGMENDGRISNIQTEEGSASVSNRVPDRYTADSFAHFQDEWLEQRGLGCDVSVDMLDIVLHKCL